MAVVTSRFAVTQIVASSWSAYLVWADPREQFGYAVGKQAGVLTPAGDPLVGKTIGSTSLKGNLF